MTLTGIIAFVFLNEGYFKPGMNIAFVVGENREVPRNAEYWIHLT